MNECRLYEKPSICGLNPMASSPKAMNIKSRPSCIDVYTFYRELLLNEILSSNSPVDLSTALHTKVERKLKQQKLLDTEMQRRLRRHVSASVNTILGEFTMILSVISTLKRPKIITYGRATSKRFSIALRTSWSWSVLTNEIARPLVPKRPARPTRCRYESASAGRS